MTIFLFVAFSVEVSVRFPGEANEGGQHVVRNFVAREAGGRRVREAGGHEKPAGTSEGRCSCNFYLEINFVAHISGRAQSR